jgi:hypothetical protein
MKIGLLIALLATSISGAALAQSPFAGFYGQVSSGYESNQLSKISGSSVETPYDGEDVYSATNSQVFGGAPLMLGLGYYWQAHPSWLVGVGVDYSALSLNSPSRQGEVFNAPGSNLIPSGTSMTTSGAGTQLSNRFNIFISPGLLIERDKLLYLKLGYSQVNASEKRATSVTITTNGKSTTLPTTTAGSSDNASVGGYLIGLGYRQVIKDGFYVFAEANYMDYGKLKQSYTSNGNSASKTLEGFSNASTTNITTSQNLSTYQFLVGLGYSF